MTWASDGISLRTVTAPTPRPMLLAGSTVARSNVPATQVVRRREKGVEAMVLRRE